jgi:uncharacterized phiE125 gp8 family phage protein
MALIPVQGPMVDAVELDIAKARLRIDTTADDEVVRSIIAAATAMMDGADGLLGRALMPQSWRLDVAEFPASKASSFRCHR